MSTEINENIPILVVMIQGYTEALVGWQVARLGISVAADHHDGVASVVEIGGCGRPGRAVGRMDPLGKTSAGSKVVAAVGET